MDPTCQYCSGIGAYPLTAAAPDRYVWHLCARCHPEALDTAGAWLPGVQPYWFGSNSPIRPDLAPLSEPLIQYHGDSHARHRPSAN